MKGLPDGTKMSVEEKTGRTVLRVELPPGTPHNRKSKRHIKAIIRKKVKLAKKNKRKELLENAKETVCP